MRACRSQSKGEYAQFETAQLPNEFQTWLILPMLKEGCATVTKRIR